MLFPLTKQRVFFLFFYFFLFFFFGGGGCLWGVLCTDKRDHLLFYCIVNPLLFVPTKTVPVCMPLSWKLLAGLLTVNYGKQWHKVTFFRIIFVDFVVL